MCNQVATLVAILVVTLVATFSTLGCRMVDREAPCVFNHPFKRLQLSRRSALPDTKSTPVVKAVKAAR